MVVKASFGLSTYILLVGKIVVEIILLSVFTSQVVVPGISASEIIESVSLGNSLATTINALALQDEGQIQITFSKEFLVVTGFEDGKNYISIVSGEKEKKVFVEPRLKDLFRQKTKALTIKKESPSKLIGVIPE